MVVSQENKKAIRKAIMSWFGKVAGGTVGFFFGGPLGAICGAALGHAFVDKKPVSTQRPKIVAGKDETQALYFVTLFSILGKLSKIDGAVCEDEIEATENFMKEIRLNPDQRKFAIETFNEAKNSPYAIEDLATQFYKFNKHSPEILRSLLNLLFRIVAADGKEHPAEESALRGIKTIFQISEQEFTNLRRSFFDDFDRYYSRLECTPKSRNEEIKRNYRRLANDFHPDKIISKGLPEEFVNFATDQFQEIQEAYHKIRKHRNF